MAASMDPTFPLDEGMPYGTVRCTSHVPPSMSPVVHPLAAAMASNWAPRKGAGVGSRPSLSRAGATRGTGWAAIRGWGLRGRFRGTMQWVLLWKAWADV